jgi:SPP1 gp7 family putative phage head morphogenesis protein
VAFSGKPIPALLDIDRQVRKSKGKPPRKRLRKIRRQRIPKGIERELRSAIFRHLEKARDIIRKLLIPRLEEIEGRARITTADRADAEPWPESVRRIMENVRSEFAAAEASLETATVTAANKAAAFNQAEVTRQLRGVLGVDVFVAEPKLAEAMAAAISESTALIKSIPARYFDEIEAGTMRAFRTGARASDVGKDIAARFGVSQKRGAFIARDQMSKLNGQLTRDRQIGLGVKGYIWRTAGDERVRDDHAALDGTKQSWDSPPVVDSRTGRREHPGGDFNCRCTAEPDLNALL